MAVGLVKTNLERHCTECLEIKPLYDFGYHPYGWQNRRSKCKPCNKIKRYTYGKNNPERESASKRGGNLRRNYGMTESELLSMQMKQGNRCAICNQPPKITKTSKRLGVDHCHKTKRIRGLLCNSCNLGLGKFKDNPDYLKQALVYLGEGS